MSVRNGSMMEHTKPILGKAASGATQGVRKAGDVFSGLRYDPHPVRTKAVFGAKVASAAMVIGAIIGRTIKRGKN